MKFIRRKYSLLSSFGVWSLALHHRTLGFDCATVAPAPDEPHDCPFGALLLAAFEYPTAPG